MAEENQDEFAQINKKVKDQVSELFSLIFMKYPTAMQLMLSGGEKMSLFTIDDGHLILTPNESNKLSVFADNCILMANALKLYKYFYDKGIKQSETWRKFPVMEKQQNSKDKFATVDENAFANIEVESDNVKPACAKVIEAVNSVAKAFNGDYSMGALSKNTFTNEKLMKSIPNIQTLLNNAASAINDSWSVLGKPSDENFIKNFGDVKDDLEKNRFIRVGDFKEDEKEEGGEEAPKEVQQAVNAVAKEVITVNDKPDDPNIAEKFKKVESDLAKAKEIVLKWADPKNNKSMANKMNKLIAIIGKDVANQIIPQAWIFNAMNHIKDLLGEAIAQKEMLAFLNENDEVPAEGSVQQGQGQQGAAGGEETPKEDENEKNEKIEKVKTLVNAVDDILKKQKPGEFKDAYNKWLKEVQEILKAAAENEKLKEKMQQLLGGDNADPYKQICLLYLALTSKDEEKQEEQPNAEGGEETGEQKGENTEGGEETEKPGQQQNASFAWHFTNYIKEALNK